MRHYITMDLPLVFYLGESAIALFSILHKAVTTCAPPVQRLGQVVQAVVHTLVEGIIKLGFGTT